MRTCYTVSLPAMINICRAVYTNKKILYDSINIYSEKYNAKINFQGAFGYETRKFTYNNLQKLLKTILPGESFALKFQCTNENNESKSFIIEITRHVFNQTTIN